MEARKWRVVSMTPSRNSKSLSSSLFEAACGKTNAEVLKTLWNGKSRVESILPMDHILLKSQVKVLVMLLYLSLWPLERLVSLSSFYRRGNWRSERFSKSGSWYVALLGFKPSFLTLKPMCFLPEPGVHGSWTWDFPPSLAPASTCPLITFSQMFRIHKIVYYWVWHLGGQKTLMSPLVGLLSPTSRAGWHGLAYTPASTATFPVPSPSFPFLPS